MYKRKLMMLLILISQVILNSSCIKNTDGEGPITTQSRKYDDFTGIDFDLQGRLILTQDSNYSVKIVTYQNYHNYIDTRIVNKTLIIDANRYLRDDDITIYISVKELNHLNLSGSGNINTNNHFIGTCLDISLTGSGNIDFWTNQNTLSSRISGSGNIILYGETDIEDLTISGSGNIYSFGLTSNSSKAKINGSGNIELFANNYLDATIAGSGDIKYKGNPYLIKHISGSGRVQHID